MSTRTLARISLAVALSLGTCLPAVAHETDQFTLPAAREFADVGDLLTLRAYNAVNEGVNRINARIRSEIQSKRSPAQYHTPDAIAAAVNAEFPAALFLIDGLDKQMIAPSAKEQFPGRIVGYKPTASVRQYVSIPLSPFNAWECATIKAYGVTLGTDKIGHFTDMGMHYFRAYRKAIKAGANEDQARAKATYLGTDEFIFAESGLLGWSTAGAYSNADLVANLMGMMFYRNLTEPVNLKGAVRPAMLQRDGEYWKLAPHVRPDSNFFSLFISEHFDEALNPSVYLPKLRKGIRKAIVAHGSDTLERYRDPNGNRRSEPFFRDKVQELSTYWGVQYGHRGDEKDLMSIASTCFGELPENAPIDARDSVGRTPLHRAAVRGDVDAIARLIDAGADPNVQVRSKEEQSSEWGSTPLHLAAANGQIQAAMLLLGRGADVNARNDRGATPLHRAIENPQMAQLLLERGADVKAVDVRGRSALHWAANEPRGAALTALIQHKADPNQRDADGAAPLHFAARSANVAGVGQLIAAGANANVVDAMGVTPLHLAAKADDTRSCDMLIRHGAQVNARDSFGCTPLHDAMHPRGEAVVAVLARAGAMPDAPDEFGVTPLELAVRTGREQIAGMLRGEPIAAVDGMSAAYVEPAEPQGSAQARHR
jgi:ankyrin repeat protein